MHIDKPGDEVMSMDDYTVEPYDDPRETREWFERFLSEHNGKDWRRTLGFSVADLLTGEFPKAANGETTRICWYRIKFKGVLVGYADTKVHPTFNGRHVISDVWIVPKFRHRGHFHGAFTALVECTNAVGVCILTEKYRSYGGWYESFGFEWALPAGHYRGNDLERSPLFVTTRDACKDMIRFLITYFDGYLLPSSDRGKMLFEEVRTELENERTRGC
jgi:ribosomal protein S18 acetylase RimI-like enzyme